MMIGTQATASSSKDTRSLRLRFTAVGMVSVLAAGLIGSLAHAPESPVTQSSTSTKNGTLCRSITDCPTPPGTESLAHTLFSQAMLPFELVGVLLLVAVIAALALHSRRGKAPEAVQQPSADHVGAEC